MYEDLTLRAVMEKFDEGKKPTGRRFETYVDTLVKGFADSENAQRAKAGLEGHIRVAPYSSRQDRESGTDIMFYDESGFFGHNGVIRFDITHNFAHKDNMPFVKSPDSDPLVIEGLYGHGYEFCYGIRTGNTHHNFEEPVVVIGFEMPAREYARFEDDLKAQRSLAENIYEIVNMSNDMLQSFYYQADENTKKAVDAEFDADERPDVDLITFNKNYLAEAGRYASRKWKLAQDTELSRMSRELLRDMVYSPAIERLAQKYEERAMTDAVADIGRMEDKGRKI